ncbi:MAG: serpin family protein [Elusimicrobiota bacterium]|nr:serpin family protein [Elusimicrobiota bacterium]
MLSLTKSNRFFCCFLLLFLFFQSVYSEPDNFENPRITEANTKFGIKLFKKLIEEHKNGNVFISPISIAMALEMVCNGANGETKQAMEKTLELQGLSLQEINKFNYGLKNQLEKKRTKIELNISNSLWIRKGEPLVPDFIDSNKEFYDAEVNSINFASLEAVPTINRWVFEKTKGKIENIIGQLDPENTVLVVTNAIYFKGVWEAKFDKSLTKNRVFYIDGGKNTKIQMMSQKGEYLYYENDDFQAVSIPYYDREISMYFFLPAKNSGLQQLCQKLDYKNLGKWMYNFYPREGEIVIPRFKTEYGKELVPVLSSLGMKVAFENADFSGIRKTGGLFISNVIHKAFLDVNEEGTEAAASTVVAVSKGIETPTKKQKLFKFVVDRPFLCIMRDNSTGTILFLGSFANPQ